MNDIRNEIIIMTTNIKLRRKKEKSLFQKLHILHLYYIYNLHTI